MPRSLTNHIDTPRELGVRLKAAREKAGLSQRQLAFPGCTAAYISRLEAGARVPSLQMVNQLASRLDVSGQWLATGVEPAIQDSSELFDAEVALRLGDVEDAEKIYRAHLQPGDPARPAALAGLGQIAFRAWEIEEAIDWLEQALEARGGSALADPAAIDTLARALSVRGSIESAIALADAAVKEAKAAGATLEELKFSVLHANALIDVGAYGRAEAAIAGVIELAEPFNDPLTTARVFWSQSRLHSMRDERELAARYARRALAILDRTENDQYVAMAYHMTAYAEIETGNYAEALVLLERARELYGEIDDRRQSRFSIEEARAHLGLGNTAEAARAAGRVLATIDAMDPADRGRAYVTLGDVFVGVGDRERARMVYGQGLELLIEHSPRFAIDAGRKLAELLEADGDTAGALEMLKRATQAAAASGANVSA
jgi:tetratricopeptide (TPR) repeat protein